MWTSVEAEPGLLAQGASEQELLDVASFLQPWEARPSLAFTHAVAAGDSFEAITRDAAAATYGSRSCAPTGASK